MSVLANLIRIGTCQHFVSAIHLYFAKIVRFKSLSVHKFRNPLMINSLLDQQSAKRTNHHHRSSVRLQFSLKVKLYCARSDLLVCDWLKISIRESSLEFLNSNSIMARPNVGENSMYIIFVKTTRMLVGLKINYCIMGSGKYSRLVILILKFLVHTYILVNIGIFIIAEIWTLDRHRYLIPLLNTW